jgi:hypothetical protein
MERLRGSKLIAGLVLAWFALFLGSAVASTVIKPGGMQMVCSAGGGMKMIDVDGDGGEAKASASMDCPLCAAVAALPTRSSSLFIKPSALEHALHPIAAAHIVALTAPPLPSRGPPSFLL